MELGGKLWGSWGSRGHLQGDNGCSGGLAVVLIPPTPQWIPIPTMENGPELAQRFLRALSDIQVGAWGGMGTIWGGGWGGELGRSHGGSGGAPPISFPLPCSMAALPATGPSHCDSFPPPQLPWDTPGVSAPLPPLPVMHEKLLGGGGVGGKYPTIN